MLLTHSSSFCLFVVVVVIVIDESFNRDKLFHTLIVFGVEREGVCVIMNAGGGDARATDHFAALRRHRHHRQKQQQQ